MKYIIAIAITCSFLFAWDKAFSQELTTGNLLPNSGNGRDWNSTSTDIINSGSSGYVSNGSTVDGFTVTCDTGQANCGYKHDIGGDFEVTGTAKLSVNDIALTNNSINQSMLDNGVTLNSKIDVANCDSVPGNCEGKKGNADSHTTTVQLKDSSGNVLSTSSQTRTNPDGFQGNCNGYPGSSASGVTTGCGQYTDTITFTGTGSNKVDWAWSGTDGNSTTSLRGGPNLLGSSLTMTYTDTNYDPIDEDTQDVIDDIDQDIVDIIDDLPEDFDWNNDEYIWEDEYVVEDDFYFEEEYTMDENMYFEEFEMEEFDITEFEQPPMFEDFEEFEEFDMEEMPTMEEVFFEEDYIMEPPPMMMEEIFTEEFEEDFTDFIEETGMEEEFMEFLEEEGITAEEFFEEITEEEFNDELTEESFEEFEEEMVEGPINEESPPEIIEETKETSEETDVTSEPIEEEKEVASNEPTREEESTEEDKPSSEDTEESDVQAEDSEEQDGVQSEGTDKVDTDDRIVTDVAKVESKLKKNLKAIAKQIAKVTKETTQNLTKEDIFFKNNTLDAYNKTKFYKSKDIYNNQNLDLFNQVDLSVYNKEIYGEITLASYSQNDPVEVHRVQLQEAVSKTRRLQLELEAMKK